MSQVPVQKLPIDAETSPIRRRFFALQKRVSRADAWQMRLGAWSQGWILITAAAFGARWYFGELVPWKAVALAGAGQSVLLAILWMHNVWRWHQRYNLRQAEMRVLSQT